MKKSISLLLIITVLLTLVACDKSNKKMTISSATLSEKEESIIKLLSVPNDSKVFDYTLDDTVKSIVITCHTLNEDMKWEDQGAILGDIETSSGRIGITIDNGLQISIESGSNGISTIKPELTELLNLPMNYTHATSWLSESSIEPDKEIPLLIKVYTDSNSIVSYDTASYFKPEHLKGNDLVIAVTVCFSTTEQ